MPTRRRLLARWLQPRGRAEDSLLPAAAVFRVLDRLAVRGIEGVCHLVLPADFAPVARVVVDQRLFAVDGGDHGDLAVPAAIRADAGVGTAVIRTALVEHDVLVAAGKGGGFVAHGLILALDVEKTPTLET